MEITVEDFGLLEC